MGVTFAPCRGAPAKSRTMALMVVESPGTAVLRTSFDAFRSTLSQSGALSFSTKSSREAFCVSVTIVWSHVVFAFSTSSKCWLGKPLASAGAVYVNTTLPFARVGPEAGEIVPNTSVVSIFTTAPWTGPPELSVTDAMTCAVPPTPMTGVVVARSSLTIGIGSFTLICMTFVVVPVDAPLTTVALRLRSPWMNGTDIENRAWPETSVVAEELSVCTPYVRFSHTEAPEMGAKSREPNTSTVTVPPAIARSGAVIETVMAPEGSWTPVAPGRLSLDKDQKLYSSGGVFTHPTHRSLR